MGEGFEGFSESTRHWFASAFEAPTPVQREAWAAIGRGEHALVIAPTGSGKTLAAFLSAIDRLASEHAEQAQRTQGAEHAEKNAGKPRRGVRVLYLSPLKALGVDVERNLRRPLEGIAAAARELGAPVPEISVGVRTGDTGPAERRALVSRPPEILITTPESLFLMLTSRARETLDTVETVIVDEIHSLAGTKRGAHLAVSLERLDARLPAPAQRIGLSATVRPPEEVARFLAGDRPVSIVAPPAGKRFDLRVVVPLEDLGDLAAEGGTIWPHVEEAIVDEVLAHRSSIVFANSRRLAERLTARLNEIVAEREGVDAGPASTTPEAGPPSTPGVGPPSTPGGMPALLASTANSTSGAAPVLARAHHGSVSREERAVIEDQLKHGELRCVVATSSLELGIDMGAVDLVVQVEAPPSVASGLQRVGRAGHGVGEVSRGVLFPKHRADLLHATVVADRMIAGAIEATRVPQNPLDLLAQHTIAASAMEVLDVEEWFALLRRSAPFAELPRSAYEATLDLIAGRYPSDRFGELRPRVVWDREANTVTGRPGAQRLAVTSGGTIPDRGLFGVFMAGEGAGRRVGELDEEMVYESRVGDVFALGTTSWRIQEIGYDRVTVTPAFGQPGRMPFWKGDGIGRPAELGRAIGAFTRELGDADPADAERRLRDGGLDALAAANLIALLADQRQATGVVPDDRTLLVERFPDELGDWRVVLHSPYGMRVHAPWALAVGARVREEFGLDANAVAADDGIVLRIPDTGAEPPGAELFAVDPGDLTARVTASLADSSLFASRFRECAARALLLPKQNPARRSPLWQQRRRASQLLDVARDYPDFPIILEAARECLQDVYDLDALRELAERIDAREVRIVETRTATASPYAQSLLFGYVGEFMYEGDQPLAERRAAALALDTGMLAELLGTVELRELLDPGVLAAAERELQRLAPERHARGVEGVADLIRELGPLDDEELADRVDAGTDVAGAAAELVAAGRAIRVRLAGTQRLAAVEDAGRLSAALGIPVPPGVPTVFADPVDDPLGDLVSRYARTHGPFSAAEAAAGFGLTAGDIAATLRRLAQQHRLAEGEFRPDGTGLEWCDAEVLARIRRRSLAALRREVEPVPQRGFARFLPGWQHVGGRLRGVDGVASVVEQLEGARVPASALESLVLPARIADYRPAMLDELTSTGEVLWAGAGELAGDGWVSLHPADTAPLTLAAAEPIELSALEQDVLATLGTGGGYFFRQLAGAIGSTDDDALTAALWRLVWAGLVGGDTLAPVRALLEGGAHRSRRPPPRVRSGARRMPRAPLPSRGGPPNVAGRWSALPLPSDDGPARAQALGETLLERYGVVTRGSVAAEGVPGGFALAYRTLAAFEDAGRARRGYFVEGLGAAQFATPAVVDRLRAQPETGAVALAATDPANPFGAALPWPAGDGSHRPARKAGAIVVICDGVLAAYLERGGRSLLVFDDDPVVLGRAAEALAVLVRRGGMDRVRVETVNGDFVIGTAAGAALARAGFRETPRGLALRPVPA
ncbi:ATP-dependent helicase [Agromyces archimandritae]|uniref:ATP-dependent helicase n=1 Tax=Agromyces archimandritae TaxID=2781962 RepID=A0A975FN60_9MICO|nr:ATP-dependent helicase [Agromyces archimandritae]QTX05006.1 ATP-dependent helicase [Agromyces archimandritae]